MATFKTVMSAESTFFPPSWVEDLLGKYTGQMELVAETVVGAAHLSDTDLHAEVRNAYEKVLKKVSGLDYHPVRFWNNVPRITAPASRQRNRYMVFNEGRYDALAHFYGNASQFDQHMPTATAVNAGGDDVKIFCLCADKPSTPLNNPRQVAPYHYSKRFGPLPPCFARAVRLTHPANWLVVGGTAAIRGEDSVYREDLSRQIQETFANLAALIAAARGETCVSQKHSATYLSAYRELRIYFPNLEHESQIREATRAAFQNVQRVEMVLADLCREELLVEIEGVAELCE
jgi:chorismate lyase/3-hydroxybenzoate synthase